jgi:hypothetical protein
MNVDRKPTVPIARTDAGGFLNASVSACGTSLTMSAEDATPVTLRTGSPSLMPPATLPATDPL